MIKVLIFDAKITFSKPSDRGSNQIWQASESSMVAETRKVTLSVVEFVITIFSSTNLKMLRFPSLLPKFKKYFDASQIHFRI